jgi:hypothetical protein
MSSARSVQAAGGRLDRIFDHETSGSEWAEWGGAPMTSISGSWIDGDWGVPEARVIGE